MNLPNRIDDFATLGMLLHQLNTNTPTHSIAIKQQSHFNRLIHEEQTRNPWFTPFFLHERVKQIAADLSYENLMKWLKPYNIDEQEKKSTVAVIMSGNIPLVGFHDALSVLITGHKLIAKHSSKDYYFFQFIFELLCMIQPKFKENIIFTDDKPEKFDAIIATGSNNTSRYFNYYFGHYPHIIRKNRNSIAIIEGNENEDDYYRLGKDIFQFFGLGCRNVAKIFIPSGFDIAHFFEGIEPYQWIIDHYKYANNYDYNKTIWLMQNEMFFDNNFLLLKKDKNLSSPIGTVFYEEYKDQRMLMMSVEKHKDDIQCIAGNKNMLSHTHHSIVPFGNTQVPSLGEYADNIDTITFLTDL